MKGLVTLIVQGPESSIWQRYANEYLNDFQIVRSGWAAGKNGSLESDEYDNRIEKITPSLPVKPDSEYLEKTSSFYYALSSFYNGLVASQTDYIIKMRSDEYFERLDYFAYHSLAFSIDKPTFTNIFAKPFLCRPFHISDHLIFGRRDYFLSAIKTLLDMYDGRITPQFWCNQNHHLHTFVSYPAESIMAFSLMYAISGKFETGTIDMMRASSIAKYFNLIPISRLGDHSIRAAHVGFHSVNYKSEFGINSINDF